LLVVSHTRRHEEHLSAEGGVDPIKLKHRCIAQQKIYQHARSYMSLKDRVTDISGDDWAFYSKAIFLLARQCASAGLSDQALSMVQLSVEANGRATIRHRVFCFYVTIIGWRNASKLVQWMGK